MNVGWTIACCLVLGGLLAQIIRVLNVIRVYSLQMRDNSERACVRVMESHPLNMKLLEYDVAALEAPKPAPEEEIWGNFNGVIDATKIAPEEETWGTDAQPVPEDSWAELHMLRAEVKRLAELAENRLRLGESLGEGRRKAEDEAHGLRIQIDEHKAAHEECAAARDMAWKHLDEAKGEIHSLKNEVAGKIQINQSLLASCQASEDRVRDMKKEVERVKGMHAVQARNIMQLCADRDSMLKDLEALKVRSVDLTDKSRYDPARWKTTEDLIAKDAKHSARERELDAELAAADDLKKTIREPIPYQKHFGNGSAAVYDRNTGRWNYFGPGASVSDRSFASISDVEVFLKSPK